MSLFYQINDTQIIISGNTYHHRQQIKDLGGKFNPTIKTWSLEFNQDLVNKVNKLCTEHGGGAINQDQHPDQQTSIDYFLSINTSDPKTSPSKLNLNTTSIDPQLDPNPNNNHFSVKQLASMIKNTVEEKFTDSVWVVGEIQDFRHGKKDYYFSLAHCDPQDFTTTSNNDQSSNSAFEITKKKSTIVIKTIIWSNVYQRLLSIHGKKAIDNLLTNGIIVKLRAKINFFLNQSTISLYVNDIDPAFTKGHLALQREKITNYLIKKNIFDNNKKLLFTKFPRKIGLISALNSQAYHDFTHQLALSNYGFHILFTPCAMQGAQTSKQLVKCLDVLSKHNCDAIVITRGGGGEADLHWFNDLNIANKILTLNTPILAAIGHHQDQCVVQDIAYKHLKTPTSVADFLNQTIAEALFLLNNNSKILSDIIKDSFYHHNHQLTKTKSIFSKQISALINTEANQLKDLKHQLNLQVHSKINDHTIKNIKLFTSIETSSSLWINQRSSKLEKLTDRLSYAINKYLNDSEIKLRELKSSVTKLDPSLWIEQGWTKITSNDLAIHSINQLKPHQTIKIALVDGVLTAKVTDLKSYKNKP